MIRRLLTLLLALTCARLQAVDDLDARIARVQNGLRGASAIRGQAARSMTIAERLEHYNVPGVSVAVISGGRVEWARGFGVMAKDGKPVGPETLFQAASISKHVAAMVVLRLVEQGKLALDEDVNVKLRSWKVPENEFTKTEKVTLRRLLNHSAGVTVHGFPGYAMDAPVPTLVQVLNGEKPANTAPIRVDVLPGSLWRYSGGGYEVMQQLVQDVTGKSFPQLARELVLDPLGMDHSTFEQPLPAKLAANAAAAHRPDGSMIAGKWHVYPEMTAAGLWTTPSDLAKVVLEIQSPGRALQPATVREMLTKVQGDYGLGLSLGGSLLLSSATPGTQGRLVESVAVPRDSRSFSHGGANEGYRCMMFAYVSGGRGAIVMTNGDMGGPLADEILRSIAAEYGWPDYQPKERTLSTMGPDRLSHYAGEYEFADGRRVALSVEGSRYWFKASNGDRIEVFPDSEGTYIDLVSSATFFDLDGRLPTLKITVSDDGGYTEMTLGNQKAHPVRKQQ